MRNTIFAIVLLTSLFNLGCNNISLTNDEAKMIIIDKLKLPVRFHTEEPINFNGQRMLKLEENGYVIVYQGLKWTAEITDLAKPYYLGQGKKDGFGLPSLKFKYFDVEFGEITGIMIQEEMQTATVRFSLIANNITPIADLLEQEIHKPRYGEIALKKFDTGWQLANEPEFSANEYINDLWWGKK